MCYRPGPQNRFFESLLQRVLQSAPVHTGQRSPLTYKDRRFGNGWHWAGAGRLTPGEYNRLRAFSDALWRVGLLPDGTKAYARAEEAVAKTRKRVPAYYRAALPQIDDIGASIYPWGKHIEWVFDGD